MHYKRPKYKRMLKRVLWYGEEEAWIPIDLSRAVPGNWGVQLALLTGPATFSRQLITWSRNGGALPMDMVLRDGFLWRRGQYLETPTEEIFFHELGLPCWPPEDRSAVKLARFLFERRNDQ